MASKDWADTSPHPWRRYAARYFDMGLVAIVWSFAVSFLAYLWDPEAADRLFLRAEERWWTLANLMVALLIAVPVNAAFIGRSGLSPGKWTFGVRVTRDGRPIGFRNALNREVDVYIKGWGLGLPVVSLVTLIRSFVRLKGEKVTAWDERGAFEITHRSSSIGSTVGMWLAILGFLGFAAVGVMTPPV
jgi:uncharacterized RDD family membrane protein YckC